MAGAISQDWERCQFPFVLDEKTHGCSGRSGRKAVEKGMKGSLLRRLNMGKVGAGKLGSGLNCALFSVGYLLSVA